MPVPTAGSTAISRRRSTAAPLSLTASCDTLDVLMPDWITLSLTDTGATEIAPADVRRETEVYRAKERPSPSLLPVVKLDLGVQADVAGRLRDPATANRVVRDLSRATDWLGAAGACLDIDQFSATISTGLVPFLTRFQRSFRHFGLESCLVLPGDARPGGHRRSPVPSTGSCSRCFAAPGSARCRGRLADESWFAETAQRARDIGGDRLVVALGNFALDWTAGTPLPEQLPYAELAYRVAARPGRRSVSAPKPATGSLPMSTPGPASPGLDPRRRLRPQPVAHPRRPGRGQRRDLVARHRGPRALAAALVDIRNPADTARRSATCGRIPRALYRARRVPACGFGPRRPAGAGRLRASGGRIVDATYHDLPAPYAIERYGQPARHQLVLTFDDGPDPDYTAEILDILKRTETPAPSSSSARG
jgi:hypothetical protein